MKVSEQWLREWVNPDVDTAGLIDSLTMAGLEVDGKAAVAPDFSGVVVGEVLDCVPHPNADKLRVTQVTDGQEQWTVVCGAPNARAGIKVALAQPGAVLPGGMKIKKTKLRGVASCGMLCGADELGLAEEASDGIMELPAEAVVGTDLRLLMQLDDQVLDVDLTPNRGDCLSVLGVARELAAAFDVPLVAHKIEKVAEESDARLEVRLDAPQACHRFVGRVLEQVDASRPTPLWLRERLRRCGIRGVNPVVDILNYVMLELGQPMHCYDRDALQAGLCVRMGRADEALHLLDGSEKTPGIQTLVVADDQQVLSVAGIMGGASSGVTSSSRCIFLEAACFDKVAMAGRARALGLHTEASHRFERGVDPQLPARAIERASQLIISICGGKAGPVTEQTPSGAAADAQQRAVIRLRRQKATQLLGIELSAERIVQLLTGLGLELEAVEPEVWSVTVPSWRFDLEIEEDLIEELIRLHGYRNLPDTAPGGVWNPALAPESHLDLRQLRSVLVNRGYREAIHFSFIDPALQGLFCPDEAAEPLANPISSEMSVMRTSLLPGLVSGVRSNLNRQHSRVRLFESGQVFRRRDDALSQQLWLGAAVCGSRYPERWNTGRESLDFFDIKGDLEALLHRSGCEADYSFRAARHPALHPGQSAELMRDQQVVGVLGALHPGVARTLDLDVPVFVFEVNAEVLMRGKTAAFGGASRFPAVRRDLALVVEQSTEAAAVAAVIRAHAGPELTDLCLFDVYSGPGVEPGRKSLALGLTWRHPDRTLQDDETEGLLQAVLEALSAQLGASLRQ
ncbi:MAG: phenylalanine--tRNA ligase subunit beta [Kistimonas sp.]|nr:phenylalanine--tRNA ligase subunit beta [Kistimonas sp.]